MEKQKYGMKYIRDEGRMTNNGVDFEKKVKVEQNSMNAFLYFDNEKFKLNKKLREISLNPVQYWRYP